MGGARLQRRADCGAAPSRRREAGDCEVKRSRKDVWEEKVREHSETKKALLVAIVGRPNVGKSTLFNRLIGSRRAIVGDEPGITRDRLYGETTWNGRRLRIVDTRGIIPDDKAFIPAEIFRQGRLALEEAAAIILVVDVRTELAAPDYELAQLLRRVGKPLFLAVNKVDTPKLEAEAENFRTLGIENLFPVSAEHGTGTAELLDEILKVVPLAEEPIADDQPVADQEKEKN